MLSEEGDGVLGPSGEVVARVGDETRLSGRLIRADSDLARQVEDSALGRCSGPYYMVGDDVTVVGPNELTELTMPNSDVVFRRDSTWKTSVLVAVPAVGFTGPGKMIIDGDCLLMDWKGPDFEERHVISWPPGFYPHIEDGTIEVRNGGGRTVARVGDNLKMTLLASGGASDGLYIPECDARLHSPIEIRNEDLPIVFPQHNDNIRSVSYISGRLEMVNGCIFVNDYIAIWPSSYTVRDMEDKVRVLDKDGKIVAQARRYEHPKQSISLKGRAVNRDDDYGRQIGKMISVDCPSADYWIVRD